MRLLGRQRIDTRGVAVLGQHRGQGDPGQPAARLREELAPVGDVPVVLQLIENRISHGVLLIYVQKLVRIEQHLRQIDQCRGARRIDTGRHIHRHRRLGFRVTGKALLHDRSLLAP